MNNKAENSNMIGVLIMTFITIIVGVILLIAAAEQIGITTDSTLFNSTVTAAANASSIDLEGQDILSTPIVVNGTNNETNASPIITGDFEFTEIVSLTTGVKTISMRTIIATHASEVVNVTYDYGSDGYIDNSGGRALASIILVFMALAIMVVALTPVLRNGLKDLMGIGN